MRFSSVALLVALLAGIGAAPALAQNVVPPKVNTTVGANLNIMDGYWQNSVTDLSIGTLKLDRFTLPAAKLAVDDPYFGSGITHNFDIYVATNFSKAMPQPYPRAAEYHPVVHMGASASGVYVESSYLSTSISWLNVEAQSGNLAFVSGAYVYTDSSGTIYTFNPNVAPGGSSGAGSQRIDNILYPEIGRAHV